MTNHLLSRTYAGKTVLVTGHTGFKGSWLSIWLHMLGARVVGISNEIPTQPSNFELSRVDKLVEDHRIDLADAAGIRKVVADTRPDYVFHLAAQALVLESYRDPLTTLATNVMGTAHVLDALRQQEHDCTVVMITSDKCYDNVEWVWGYRENDRLGGKDPYSASKSGAEMVIRTFFASYLNDSGIRLGIARAGNVIGGGDWAADRLVPDCIRAWSQDKAVTIKNPNTTRPWQLVLEPLGGYLALGARLDVDQAINGEAFNFGPVAENNFSVGELISAIQQRWQDVKWEFETQQSYPVYEAGLLKLNCDKALQLLRWRPTYSFAETVQATVDWYRASLEGDQDMRGVSVGQIEAYERASKNLDIAWAN